MPLEFDTLRDQEERAKIAGSFTLTERVCLNADKSAVVDCSSPAAAFTLGGAGTLIPMAEAEKYGLVKQEAPPTQNKMVAPTATKTPKKPRLKKKKG